MVGVIYDSTIYQEVVAHLLWLINYPVVIAKITWFWWQARPHGPVAREMLDKHNALRGH